jgi:hypothetical protein
MSDIGNNIDRNAGSNELRNSYNTAYKKATPTRMKHAAIIEIIFVIDTAAVLWYTVLVSSSIFDSPSI